jgi:hypothetical protein
MADCMPDPDEAGLDDVSRHRPTRSTRMREEALGVSTAV